MSTLFDCQDDSCVEALMESIIAGVGAVMYFQGFRRIVRDRNNLLNKVTKIIFGLGMAQIIILFMYFSFWGSDLMISTIRSLRLITEAMLCSILSEIVYEEGYFQMIQTVLKVVLGFLFVEWFWTAIVNQSIYDYYCLQMDYLFLSGTTLILTLFAAYLGLTALQLLRSFQEENDSPDRGSDENNYDEMKSRQFQIKLLLAADCLSASIQFIWDYIAYTSAHTLQDCKGYYEAQSIGGAAGFTILKSITLMLSPLTIYYVFYYKQRNQFNTSTAQLLDTDVFFDDRSNMQRFSSRQNSTQDLLGNK